MQPSASGLAACDNCGLDILWRPVVAGGRVYCCGGCARGGPCYCSYDLPVEPPALPPRGSAGRGRRGEGSDGARGETGTHPAIAARWRAP